MKLTKAQKCYLTQNRNKRTAIAMGMHLGITSDAVRDFYKQADKPPRIRDKWTEAQIQFLLDNYKAYSYSELALMLNEKFKMNYSRGAIAGKITRLVGKTKQADKVYVSKNVNVKEKLPETTDGISFYDVEKNQCQFILGHMRCCGKDNYNKSMYCLEHHNECYKKPVYDMKVIE